MKRARSQNRALLVALLLAPAFGAVGCFEGGALDAVGADGVIPNDTVIAPDDTAVLDTLPPEDTGTVVETDTLVIDTLGGDTAQDTTDTVVADTASADTVEVIPCLTVSDCVGIAAPDDKCAGTIGCVDYQCVADPSTAVVCPDDGDACTAEACDPATGQCFSADICVCVPAGTLSCGVPVNYTTGAAGETEVVDGYSCGGVGSTNTGPERVFSFSVPTAQRVRLTATATAGSLGGVWVVPFSAGDCAADGCLAGSAGETVLLDAPGNTPLAVVVEHLFGGFPVTLTAECGITTETRCNDGLDDDGDGLTDCADGNCTADPACVVTPTTEISCVNSVDDDKDGKTDCDDADCAGYPACIVVTPENCTDGVDNDGDLLADCADSDCASASVCLEPCININGLNAYCNFGQGIGNGGGYANMSHYYGCPGAPTSPAKEVIYPFLAQGTGLVTVTIAWSGVNVLHLYVLEDKGQGCGGSGCIGHDAHSVTFSAIAGKQYFIVIDGQNNNGVFNLHIDCNF
ncbi:MAG: hypothetical protein EP329_12435 [Deltaproteobacteria bacterium]|nr:MAG: hypothetical protein EP329_12435 [Deltaproteobacteria bacterium]